MMLQKIQKTIFIIVLMGGFGFLAYSVFVKASTVSADNAVGNTRAAGESSAMVGQDIIDLMTAFQALNIDSSLFSSPLFQNLKDFSTTIQPQTPGRSNPFAPIGSGNNIQTVNTTTNTTTGKTVKTNR